MNRNALFFLILVMGTPGFTQQRYFTKTGTISFKAGTAVEDVDATNNAAASILDLTSGQVEVAVLIRGFEFRRGLMQEHFNENYMESDKFPKAVFKGQLKDFPGVDVSKDRTYHAVANGTLEMHGVKKEMAIPVVLTTSGGNLSAETDFHVLLEDFHISIPGPVKDKISPTVSIHFSGDYSSM